MPTLGHLLGHLPRRNQHLTILRTHMPTCPQAHGMGIYAWQAATPWKGTLMPRTHSSTQAGVSPQHAARTTRLLDAYAAGELLGVPHTWLLREARAERIPHRRLGRYVRWSVEDVAAIAEANACGPRTGSGPVPHRRKAR